MEGIGDEDGFFDRVVAAEDDEMPAGDTGDIVRLEGHGVFTTFAIEVR